MTERYDAIVLGAGGMGSAAAYYLAKAGQRVVLIEQFELDHAYGSSYGVSRVIRYAYDHPIYINLMRAAYPLWFELQEEAQETLYIQTGGLDIGYPHQDSFQAVRHSMDETGLPYDHLTAQEVSDRFPQFRLEDGLHAFFQEATGLLKASRCVLAHIRLAQQRGATVLAETPVNRVVLHDSGVEVQTPDATFWGDRLVIAAGSWTKDLLAPHGIHLPLTIMPCQVGFFRPDSPASFRPGICPVFMTHLIGEYGEMPYGIPSEDTSMGVKVTTFYGWDTVDHPHEVDYTPEAQWPDRIRAFSRQYVPGLAGELLSTRRCLYTMTPDKHFIVDRLPHHPHVAIAAGFSGHGFKFTTLMGKILTDLVLQGKTDQDISLFQLSRFQQAVV